MTKVKFSNGQYGIRTFWFFGWYFLSLRSTRYNYRFKSKYFFEYCTASEDIVDKILKNKKLSYTKV